MKNYTVEPTAVTLNDTTWVELQEQDSSRDHLAIQNLSLVDIYLSFGTVDSEATSVKLSPGSFYEPFYVPNNAIKAKTGAGTGAGSALVLKDIKTSITTL